MEWLMLTFTGALAAILSCGLLLFLLRGAMVNWALDHATVRLLKDEYSKNLWELFVGFVRMPPQYLMEVELRAERGKLLQRPLGSVVRVSNWQGLAFNPAQLVRLPLGPSEKVDLTVMIGPRARRPLRLRMPVLVGALGYGVAIGKPFAQAMARAATLAGTAYNNGSGPLPEEIAQEARQLILQYGGGAWNRDPLVLARGECIEIRLGHGPRASLGKVIQATDLPPEARALMGVSVPGQAVHEAPVPGASSARELRRLVPELRRLVAGGPVGVKLNATHEIERELAILLEAGVDFITLDASEGGTHGSPPVICDDFGLPLLHVLPRALAFLERTGARREVSLIAAGGLRTPGEMLKAMALGADAVYAGTALMMATTHGQVSKTVPFEPITQVVWANGTRVSEFDVELGARNLTNFLQACAEELQEAARALGRRSLREISRADLVARDRETAALLGLPPSWRAPRKTPPPAGRVYRPAVRRPGRRT